MGIRWFVLLVLLASWTDDATALTVGEEILVEVSQGSPYEIHFDTQSGLIYSLSVREQGQDIDLSFSVNDESFIPVTGFNPGAFEYYRYSWASEQTARAQLQLADVFSSAQVVLSLDAYPLESTEGKHLLSFQQSIQHLKNEDEQSLVDGLQSIVQLLMMPGWPVEAKIEGYWACVSLSTRLSMSDQAQACLSELTQIATDSDNTQLQVLSGISQARNDLQNGYIKAASQLVGKLEALSVSTLLQQELAYLHCYLLGRQSKNLAAKECIEQFLDTQEMGLFTRANALSISAEASSFLGDSESSLELLNRLILLLEDGRYPNFLSDALIERSLVHLVWGQHGEALLDARRALGVSESYFHNQQTARAYYAVGVAYARSDNGVRAQHYLNKALDLSEIGFNASNKLDVLDELATVAIRENQPELAIEYLNTALNEIHSEAPIDKARLYFNLMRSFRDLGRYPEALEQLHFIESEKLLPDNHRLWPYLELARLDIYQESSDKRCVDHIEPALQGLKAQDAKHVFPEAYHASGRCVWQFGGMPEAGGYFQLAIEHAETDRRHLLSERARSSSYGKRRNIYTDYTRFLLEGYESRRNDQLESAFAVSSLNRSRTLLDRRLQQRDAGKKQELEQARELRLDAISKLSGQLVTSEAADRGLIVDQIQRLLTDAEVSSMTALADVEAVDLSVSDIQMMLDEKSLLLHMDVGAQRSIIWLISRDEFTYVWLPGEEPIKELTEGVLAVLKSPSRGHLQALNQAFEVLAKPLLAYTGGIEKLIVVPDGVLNELPWEAIPLNKPDNWRHYQPLLSRFSISYVPSTRVVTELRNKKESQSVRRVLAFGNPDLPDPMTGYELITRSSDRLRLVDLPGAEREALVIQKELGGDRVTLVTGREASRTRLLDEIRFPLSIMHLATHATLSATDSSASGLVLATEGEDNQSIGFLSMEEVAAQDLDIDLAVLSSCESAAGELLAGEGLQSLSRAFHLAGVRGVIGGLWPVSDSATLSLMTAFYKQLANHSNRPAEALRQAQLELFTQGRYRHPYYWAAFRYSGDWTLTISQ